VLIKAGPTGRTRTGRQFPVAIHQENDNVSEVFQQPSRPLAHAVLVFVIQGIDGEVSKVAI
jgi:bifunctional DNase/RNase